MTPRTFVLLLAGLLAIPSLAAAAAAANLAISLTDETALAELACQAGRAYARRDLETLDRFTADDYVQTDVRAGALNRVEWREFVKNRKSELTIECDSISVRFYGAASAVTGGWSYTCKTTPAEFVARTRWTSV